ncbi:MAG TPA: sigma-70 family RNA polymerase sigma factor, partial [Verrucomicrobiae bacterium]|nr:sigma-70 family RNA polymerase sigma factor [Verrucomicrobiae bacterium]
MTKLTPRPVRLNAPRLSRRAGSSMVLPAPVLSRNTPPAREVAPVQPASRDLPHGDVLQLYLREIGQVKLLTPAEEIVLAKRIRRGDQRAREQMIKANLRLVVKIAHDYEGMGLPLLDLINEGNIGLMKGVERFDPRKGAKLSTYASWWIKQSIKRALANQSKTIRLPVHVVDKVAHIRRAEVKLRETFDREPTDEELAHELDLDPRRIRQYRQASRAPVSLDAPIGDDASERVSEIVADPNAAAPFDRLVQETDTELVREVLGTLDQRESKILALRFGLKDGEERTLEEVGAELGVTRERIRQIQEQALKKLREKMEERDRPVD